ncbi:NAD(P)-dependent oxidoreductase [Aquimarina sp. 2201CG5-10]|uniref:NAD-dependent epimerase/dehydratase family protein n=1 Tax=Aquimarina callyspongiae TaxID=3098150 RepID=UPI002AB41A4A|nr:NAD(P)-dependent oxidoreductase [Aquimarina sp. 2201CG5-10]MDY8138642.1 NAD(P)-dependent oxidoreductase [Aquimarina sp. 2201CG5-10]
MSKPTIIITGANGFLGKCLLDNFLLLGWNIKAFVHNFPEEKENGVDYIQYSMEGGIEESYFDNVDYLIHSAYLRFEKDKRADEINFKGTKELVSICNKKNIKMVFLSSFSAHKGAVSHYGTTKLRCEELFDLDKDVVLKIGFVIGDKGILAEMINRMKTSSVFPLVGGGKQPLQSVYIQDLCNVVESVLVKELSGTFMIAHNEVISMRVFYKELAQRLNRKLTFIPISISLLYLACRFFEGLRIKIPVSSESVLGLKKLTTFETLEDQNIIGIQLKSYQESLDLILE